MSMFTAEGLRVRRAREILTLFQSTYETISGETPDWDRDTFLGAIAASFSEVEGETNEAIQAVWDSIDPDNARGLALDTHMKLAGVSRQAATRSSVVLTLSGTALTLVPEGKIVEDINGERWELQEDVTIPGTGLARAVNFGSIFAPAGTITQIVTPVSGWTGVTNAAAATPGRERQSDTSGRQARLRALDSGATASFRGVRREIERLNFVEASVVIHNPTSSPQTVRGVALPANSYSVIVFPDTITAEEETELFEAVVENGPIGIESVGAEERLFDGWPIRFSYATGTPVNITVSIIVDTDNFGVPGVIAEVELALERFIAALRVGDPVRLLSVSRAVSGVSGVLGLASTLIGGSASDLILNANQYPTPGTITATEA